MSSRPSQYLGITFLLAAFLSVAVYPSKAGQSPTAPIPTYIYGRADFVVGNQPVVLASGDFNGDGQPDMVVVNQADNTVSVLLGKPDGTFAPHVDYPTGPVPTRLLVGDFNRDGNLDIAVVNQNCAIQTAQHFLVPVLACGNGTISVLLGNGDGTFATRTDYDAGGIQPVAIASGDFNGDGSLDLAIAHGNCLVSTQALGPCGGGSGLSVLLGDGAGGFQTPVRYTTAGSAYSVVVADFNGDHKLDIAVAGGGQSGAGTISFLAGNGDGTFQGHVDSNLGATNGLALAVADFNGDGKMDLASTGNFFVDIMIGNGDGTFLFKQHYDSGYGATVAVGDFNGDGKTDLGVTAVTNGFANYSLAVMLGNGDGTFQAASQYSTGINPQAVIAADLNGDGKLDLAAVCSPFAQPLLPGTLSVVLGFGDGTFAGSTPVGTGRFSITSGDLNGDGKVDIASTNSLFLGNGDGTFQTVANLGNYVTDPSANFVAAADFNGDGKTDLAVINSNCPSGAGACNPGSVSVFLGTGDFLNTTPGPYQPRVDYAVGPMPNMLTIGDFNGDNKPDLAVSNGAGFPPASISVLPGKGDGTFQTQIQISTPGTVWIANGDFDGDGKLDVAVVTPSSVVIYLGNGDGTFHQGSSYSFNSGDGTGSITAADLNHDGKLDLAVIRNTNDAPVVSVFLGNGDGTFQPPSDYPTLGSGLVQATDINGDGKLDLLIASYSIASPFAILIGNGDGTFRLPVTYFVPSGGANPFTIADFNRDGVPDVASISFDGNVGVLLSTPFVSVSPAALNFSGQGVGTISLAQKITISNGTDAPYSITGAVASGNFTATNNCSALQPGANCTVTVRLSPSATGTQTGTLTITDSTRTSPEIIPLTGTGVNGAFLTAFPARLTFSSQTVGATSSPLSLQLVNTGNVSLTLNSIGITGSNGPDFHQTNTCGGSLAAGAGCTVNITFIPTAGGYRAASLSVSDSETGSPQLIPVFGTGSAFAISATPFSPATQTVGFSSTSTVSVTSFGGFSGSVNLSCSGVVATGVSCSLNPATVTASSAGPVTSTLTVSTTQSAPAAAYTFTVTGSSGGFSQTASQVLNLQASSQQAVFSLAPNSSGSSSASVTAGQSATFALSATSSGGFAGTVNLTCTVSPTPSLAPTCTVPATVQIAAGTPSSFSVTLATTARTSAQLWIPSGVQNLWATLTFSGLFALVFALVQVEPGAGKKRKNYLLAALLISVTALVGCGGGSSGGGGGTGGTPTGNYTITVVGTSGSINQTTTLKLTVQ
jgi:hypothetical protein